MNNNQRNQLEDAALAAFSGNSSRDLAHGFRIQTTKGQVAALYWSDLHAGNDVEIALADNRITDLYEVGTVQRWLQREREQNPRPCNVHKHGSDWAILGFHFDAALAFLKRAKQLRLGFLPNELVDELNARQRAESPAEQSAARLRAELAALRPSRQHAVIDLVRRAGISVGPWYVRADGTPAVTPRSNPAHCYNWAFGGQNQPSLACVWHSSLGIGNDRIQMQANIRDLAMRLEEFAADLRQPNEHRDRARTQAVRARQLDSLLSNAAAHATPLRVIVNEGDMRSEADLGRESSVVRIRHLDPVAWRFARYDTASGDFLLQRDLSESVEPPVRPRDVLALSQERYVDQHDLAGSDSPQRKAPAGSALVRDAAVRAIVLDRAEGHCEFCDTPGFLTPDGRLYAETHHVIPLGEGGVDRIWNVVALCSNHHREAHFGAASATMRAHLLSMLLDMYPTNGRSATAV